MSKTKYIAVAGNIGCGKSTLVDFICKTYNVEPFFEPNAENPYLVDFYRDMKRWAFHSQIYFLTHKFRIHRELENRRKTATVIQDRTIYEDAEIFAAYLRRRRFILKREWALYNDLYQTIFGSTSAAGFDDLFAGKCSNHSQSHSNARVDPKSSKFRPLILEASISFTKVGLRDTNGRRQLSLKQIT